MRGRPRLGASLKETYTVCLEPLVAASLRAMGHNNLSAGIAIAEFQARGGVTQETRRPLRSDLPGDRDWIVFEIVDGPPDPPQIGDHMDPFREARPLPWLSE